MILYESPFAAFSSSKSSMRISVKLFAVGRHVYRISVGGFNLVRSQKSSSKMEHRNHKIEVNMYFLF